MSHIQIINADCRGYLVSPFCPHFDLIIADPPFNIGQGYQGFVDKMTKEAYYEFSAEWIQLCWNKLAPGAAMVLHGSVEVSRVLIRLLSCLEDFIETEICWCYNFGQHSYNNFIQTHCRAIVLRKPGPRKWYVENVLTPSKRLLMNDKRVLTAEHKGMVPFGTVWGVKTDENGDQVPTEPIEGLPNWGRIQGNNSERRHGHPNQLPQRYIERIIVAYSQVGDTIYDPFAGSGTTAIAARKLGRNCITTDISRWNCESIQTNLDKIKL